MGRTHRRWIELEDKAKVVASVWGAKLVQFLAALAVLPRSIWKNSEPENKQINARRKLGYVWPVACFSCPISLSCELKRSFLEGCQPPKKLSFCILWPFYEVKVEVATHYILYTLLYTTTYFHWHGVQILPIALMQLQRLPYTIQYTLYSPRIHSTVYFCKKYLCV